MVTAPRTNRAALLLSITLLVCSAACGKAVDHDVVASKRTSAEDIAAFCAAVEQLDRTDGTTEATVAIEAFDAVRRTAPAEVRDDVIVSTDPVIINNYPGGVDPSMRLAPPEVIQAAGTRVGVYVDEHCDHVG